MALYYIGSYNFRANSYNNTSSTWANYSIRSDNRSTCWWQQIIQTECMHSILTLQAMSAPILGGSILMRVTVRSIHIIMIAQMYTSNICSGTTSVHMEILSKSHAKLDFCGTRLSLHVIGLPMFNVLLDQQQSQLQQL